VGAAADLRCHGLVDEVNRAAARDGSAAAALPFTGRTRTFADSEGTSGLDS
jgi:hypothetical protein